MKLELILLTILALAGTTLFFQESTPLSQSDSVYTRFSQWKSTHRFTFSEKENEYRYAVFQENLKIAEEFNRINNFTLGVTSQFAAMTNEEFRSVNGNQVLRENQPTMKSTGPQNDSPKNANDINWVTKGAVQVIQNQGQCGSCWAFSAVSQLEGFYFINGNSLENFSEQQVTSCTPAPSLGCNGGYPEGAMQYAATNGLEQASYYPYVQLSDGHTAACNYEADQATDGINKGYGNVTPNNPSALLEQLQSQPVSILVDGGSFVFQLYSGGIVDSESCGTSLDHAISLVAWTSQGATDGVFTVRNSWGNTWGEKGYMQIAYSSGNGYCGMNMSPSYPTN